MKKLDLFSIFILISINIYAQVPGIQWKKCMGGTGDDRVNCIKQTNDGGFIVAGQTNSNNGDVSDNHGGYDYWIVKLSNSGDIEWQKCLGGTNNDYATCIQQTNDGGFIVAGYTCSSNGDVSGNHQSYDYWIVKLSNSGDIEWQKCLGGEMMIEQIPYSRQLMVDILLLVRHPLCMAMYQEIIALMIIG